MSHTRNFPCNRYVRQSCDTVITPISLSLLSSWCVVQRRGLLVTFKQRWEWLRPSFCGPAPSTIRYVVRFVHNYSQDRWLGPVHAQMLPSIFLSDEQGAGQNPVICLIATGGNSKSPTQSHPLTPNEGVVNWRSSPLKNSPIKTRPTLPPPLLTAMKRI